MVSYKLMGNPINRFHTVRVTRRQNNTSKSDLHDVRHYFVTCSVLTERYGAVAMVTPYSAIGIPHLKQLVGDSVNHSKFTVCEVVNTEDKTPITLNTEWLDDDVKIVILRLGMAPLTGQTTITKLCASTPGKTREESVELYRNELSGKDKDVQFNLNDSRLLWKKKIWKRGTIEVKPLENIVFLVDLSLQWLKQCGSLQDTTKKLREDNEILEKRSQQLVGQMKEMERVKITMEDALYKQFLLLLNSKKRRIRELEELSKSQGVTLNRSAYDVSTDDSDVEPEEATRKKRRKAKPERLESPVASTSKRSSVSPLKPSPESDEDIVLRYDESQQPTSNLNVLEEDTEDDLFSQ